MVAENRFSLICCWFWRKALIWGFFGSENSFLEAKRHFGVSLITNQLLIIDFGNFVMRSAGSQECPKQHLLSLMNPPKPYIERFGWLLSCFVLFYHIETSRALRIRRLEMTPKSAFSQSFVQFCVISRVLEPFRAFDISLLHFPSFQEFVFKRQRCSWKEPLRKLCSKTWDQGSFSIQILFWHKFSPPRRSITIQFNDWGHLTFRFCNHWNIGFQKSMR